MSEFKKNTAGQRVYAVLTDSSDGSAITTGASIEISKDGGAAASGAGTLSHISNGLWDYQFTQSETNADVIGFVFSGANVTPNGGVIYTTTKTLDDLNDIAATDIVSDGTAINTTSGAVDTVTDVTNQITADVTALSGDSVAADNAEAFFDDTGFNASNSTIGTCTTNTDMRGTDNALLASSAPTNWSAMNITASGNVGIDWANVENPSSIVDLSATDINLCDTVTTNSDMRGTDNALLASSAPTNFSDLAITASTGKVTVGTNDDKTGYSISGSKTTLDALNDITAASVWAVSITEPSGVFTWSGGYGDVLEWLGALARNKMTQTSTTTTLRDDADGSDIATATVSDDGTTFTRGEWS